MLHVTVLLTQDRKTKPVALKEVQKYKSLGEGGGQVLPCLHFIGRTPCGKV